MNTMLKNFGKSNNLSSQIKQFAEEIKKSGKSPEQMLNDLMASGKYTQQQLEQAKNLARLFSGKI